MLEHPVRQNQGFGKRGSVSMPGSHRAAAPVPQADEDKGSGSMSVPRWAIGGLAALMLMALVSTGGGSGFFGGLLGGWLAGKMLSSRMPASTPSSASAPRATPPTATATAPAEVNRGGLGTTSSSRGSWFGFGG